MADLWKVVYFPGPDHRKSAYQYLLTLPITERDLVFTRLETLAARQIEDWKFPFLKIWGKKIWQLDGTQTRVVFCLSPGEIVVLHAFKKTKNKTNREDRECIERHHDQYTEFKKARGAGHD